VKIAVVELALQENEVNLTKECMELVQAAAKTANKLRAELLMSQSADPSSCFLEIQAGAGGTESCDWVEILMRMYTRWAENSGFQGISQILTPLSHSFCSGIGQCCSRRRSWLPFSLFAP
jgi:protein subunit release factor A